MNILILSAGTRDKVVQYFKKELAGKGRVVATDCSNSVSYTHLTLPTIYSV